MKKSVSLFLIIALISVLLAGCFSFPNPETKAYSVALITDKLSVNDQSFNQAAYVGCKQYCDAAHIKFNYFRPSEDTKDSRSGSIDKAIADSYNIIVCPGSSFVPVLYETAPNYPDVIFIAVDITKDDILEFAVAQHGEEYDGIPDNWDVNKYMDTSNIYFASFHEEISGYFAGYAAVKLGYTELGFLGGKRLPAVIRYGHGYIQGAEDAAKELGVNVNMKYTYTGKFEEDKPTTAMMKDWYANGTQVVFSCGGPIYKSVLSALKKSDGKIIGVDIDQSEVFNKSCGKAVTVTSAEKGISQAVYDVLYDVISNGKWDIYKGKIERLSLVSPDNTAVNYVKLPEETTEWDKDRFSEKDYKELVRKIYDKEISISDDIDNIPVTEKVTVEIIENQ